MWQKIGTVIVTTGAVVAVLYGGIAWLAERVVWAAQFEQTMAEQNCRFDRLERTQLEGQLADAGYRSASFRVRKQLNADDARELAAIQVREEILKQRLKDIGTECNPKAAVPASKK